MDPSSVLCFDGAEVKAKGDSGEFEGWLVQFGSEDSHDSSPHKDFFTPETDFGRHAEGTHDLLYDHTLDPDIGIKSIGEVTLEIKDAGVWMQGQIEKRDAYEKAIAKLLKAGKLGSSSGTASHLVRREQKSNGSHRVVTWPLGLDASLTPTPAEHRNEVYPIKSLLACRPGFQGPSLLERSVKTVADLEELSELFRKAIAARQTEGRTLSADKVEALKSIRAALDSLLNQADPSDGTDLYDAFLIAHARANGVGV